VGVEENDGYELSTTIRKLAAVDGMFTRAVAKRIKFLQCKSVVSPRVNDDHRMYKMPRLRLNADIDALHQRVDTHCRRYADDPVGLHRTMQALAATELHKRLVIGLRAVL
jgi:hypothetical protein